MDVEIEQPHQHHHTGHHWLDKVLPISALFVSLISILIAFHHGKVMQELVAQNERLVEANSLPYVTHTVSADLSQPGNRTVRLFFANKGIGPAEIRWAEVRLDGKVMNSPQDAVTACCLSAGKLKIAFSSLVDTMLQPGESSAYLDLAESGAPNETIPKLTEAASSAGTKAARLTARICYCSVFEECWMAGREGRPEPVKACPMPEKPAVT